MKNEEERKHRRKFTRGFENGGEEEEGEEGEGEKEGKDKTEMPKAYTETEVVGERETKYYLLLLLPTVQQS